MIQFKDNQSNKNTEMKKVVKILFLLIILRGTADIPIINDSLTYQISKNEHHTSDVFVETFDALLGIRIGGFKGIVIEDYRTTGSKQISVKEINTTGQTYKILNSYNTTGYKDTVGKVWQLSIFGSYWKDTTEYEDISNQSHSTSIWIASPSNGWHTIEDFIIAMLQDYHPTINTQIRGVSLPGVDQVLNYTNTAFEIVNLPSDSREHYVIFNSTKQIFNHYTGNLFSYTPYYVENVVDMIVDYNPQTGIIHEAKYQQEFRFVGNASGQVEDEGVGSLVDANMAFDLNKSIEMIMTLDDQITITEEKRDTIWLYSIFLLIPVIFISLKIGKDRRLKSR
ncbi:MAG: hypothetical protein INQ03_20780 [Candidatus Heimdallarchaeota archaeon]|nr:hypothetical protein [Candidatus Heimdallarchaeota archaeon]